MDFKTANSIISKASNGNLIDKIINEEFGANPHSVCSNCEHCLECKVAEIFDFSVFKCKFHKQLDYLVDKTF